METHRTDQLPAFRVERPFYLPYESDPTYMAAVEEAGYKSDCVGFTRRFPDLQWGRSHETQDGDRWAVLSDLDCDM